MKIAKNRSHNLRHDWLSFSSNRGKVEVSLLAMRNEICVDVTINGVRRQDWIKPERLAEALVKAIDDKPSQIEELERDKCGLAADALNTRQVLREFMAYVKAGQIPELAHCVRRAKQILDSNLLDEPHSIQPHPPDKRGHAQAEE